MVWGVNTSMLPLVAASCASMANLIVMGTRARRNSSNTHLKKGALPLCQAQAVHAPSTLFFCAIVLYVGPLFLASLT